MHFMSTAKAAGLVPEPADLHFIASALLHALGMGAVLMAVTGWVDQKQLRDSTPQANVQNSSNVLFMSVAIATVIILVGNNIARAFALGAAIALIRFKMKLGESSSGSGLLFAILCGMSSAVGLHAVGWALAIGYSLIQVGLSMVIARMPVVGAGSSVGAGSDALGAVASGSFLERERVAAENVLAARSETTLLQAPSASVASAAVTESAGGPAWARVPARVAFSESHRGRQALLMMLALLFVGSAGAAECSGKFQGDSLRVTVDHAFHAESVGNMNLGGQPVLAGDCRFGPTPVFEHPFDVREKYRIECTKYKPSGSSVAYYSGEWEKNLVGLGFKLWRRRAIAYDMPVEVLLTQSVVGNLALHVSFNGPEHEFHGIADLSPSPNGRWSVEWVLQMADEREWAVSCGVEKVESP